MVLGWPVEGITNDKDYASLKVISSILGDGLSSRLFIDLKRKTGTGLCHKQRLSFKT